MTVVTLLIVFFGLLAIGSPVAASQYAIRADSQ